jgi:hypothetical protein
MANFFCVSHNTQMLGIKYAYLMINKNWRRQFWILLIKKKKYKYEEEIDKK